MLFFNRKFVIFANNTRTPYKYAFFVTTFYISFYLMTHFILLTSLERTLPGHTDSINRRRLGDNRPKNEANTLIRPWVFFSLGMHVSKDTGANTCTRLYSLPGVSKYSYIRGIWTFRHHLIEMK